MVTETRDPATYCLSHQAVNKEFEALNNRQTKSEFHIGGIQQSIVRLEVKLTKVTATLGVLLAVFQLLLKYLPGILG